VINKKEDARLFDDGDNALKVVADTLVEAVVAFFDWRL